MDELTKYLTTKGPSLSSEVKDYLVQKLGIRADAARKQIQRRPPHIRALELKFPRGTNFLYLESQYGSAWFWKRLAAALVDSNGAYARAIWAMRARGGVIQVDNFDAAMGGASTSRQLTSNTVRERLVAAKLFQEIEIPGLGLCIAFAKGGEYLDELVPGIRARLLAEKVLLGAIQEWAAKLGLGSYFSFKLRGNMPTAGRFEWDLTAPSYLGPLATWAEGQKPKPGFLVVDVLLKESVGEEDVRPFIYKCTTVRQYQGVGRCLQFFVAHRYDLKALHAIRKAGIVPATTESLFGTEVARTLMELVGTLTTTAKNVVSGEKLDELFDKLGRIEAAAVTLRGALFEFLVADIVRRTTAGVDITMNKIYRLNGQDVAEVDVRAVVKEQSVRFIECKGLLPGSVLSDDEVERWLEKRIPIVRKQTLESGEFNNLTLKFEMWITGKLSEQAKHKIATAQANIGQRKYQVEVLYVEDIERILADLPSLLKVFKQHFLKHPLASNEAINPLSKRRLRLLPPLLADTASES